MIQFDVLDDADPALAHSPMVCAIDGTLRYAVGHDGIPLTATGAFRRVFVHWAAAAFEWPGWTEDELFAANKVVDEADFEPLEDVHRVLVELRVGVHEAGRFRASSFGLSLVGRPGRIFGLLVPYFLLELDHAERSRSRERLDGSWNYFLNVLNLEAEDGATGGELRRAFLSNASSEAEAVRNLSTLYVQVLRPLCWAGLLAESPLGHGPLEDRTFVKTPLWRAALHLGTDGGVRPATRH